jgi:hypothetical protein
MKLYRVDLIFSYWIFAWYVLYITNIVTSYNPKFLLILGIIENTILLFLMIQNGSTLSTILKFIWINIFLKIIPYYTVRNDVIKQKDIIASCILFIAYIVWLYMNKETVLQKYNEIYQSLIKNKGDTPGMMMLNYIWQKLSITEK